MIAFKTPCVSTMSETSPMVRGISGQNSLRTASVIDPRTATRLGKTLALAALRPPNTFSTFSIWKNEHEMTSMVSGRDEDHDGRHLAAMKERVRRDFHHEFTTLRFVPLKEVGAWKGHSNFTGKG